MLTIDEVRVYYTRDELRAELDKPEPNIYLLDAARAAIEAHPELWYQGNWAAQTDCGTAFCIGGWAAHIAGWETVPGETASRWRPRGSAERGQNIYDLLRDLLAITAQEYYDLTAYDNTLEHLDRYIAAIKRRAELRKHAATILAEPEQPKTTEPDPKPTWRDVEVGDFFRFENHAALWRRDPGGARNPASGERRSAERMDAVYGDRPVVLLDLVERQPEATRQPQPDASIEWDEGDDTPAPDVSAWDGWNAVMAEVDKWCNGSHNGWSCSQAPGHQGPHIARYDDHTAPGHLCAVWPQ